MELDKNLRKNPNVEYDPDITSLPSKVLLYQKAGLHLVNTEKKLKESPFKSTDMNVLFSVSGERSGIIVCSLDLTNLQKIPCNLSFLQGLFIESLNIWLGNYLSNLENNYGLMCIMSPPSFFVEMSELSNFDINRPMANTERYIIDYDLILFETSIPISCHIQWVKKDIREV